jgi:hypothetical protein
MMRARLHLLLTLLLTGVVTVAGCGGSSRGSKDEKEASAYEEFDAVPEKKMAEEPSGSAPEGDTSAGASERETGTEVASDTSAEVSERKRVYAGNCQLLVGSVEETRDALFETAERSGGYVESVLETTVVIRVPAEDFSSIFQAVLEMGEVLDSSVETTDVTEDFRDLDARLNIAVRTRERLYSLLERTSDVKERLKILREIARLTEEIEQIRQKLELLESLIAFSRITVELVPRLAYEETVRASIPFSWIASLQPLSVSLPDLRGGVTLDTGGDFAVFARENGYRAESAEGTRIRIGSTDNQPLGDGYFWQRALSFHLGPYYAEAEDVQAGDLRGVLFTSKDKNPFYYLVMVAASNRNLHVVEVFFPDESALQKRYDSILEALSEMKIR